jgi:AcrR family transcriptional regulator
MQKGARGIALPEALTEINSYMQMGLPRKATASRRTQLQRSEETKQRLFKAAIRVMNKRGYFGFTTAEAAREAGVTRGAQNHHFKSKDAFVLAAIEHLYAEILARSSKRALDATRSRDLLEPIVKDARDFFFSPEFITIFDVQIAMSKTRSKKTVAEISERYRSPVENVWVDYLIARGVERSLAHQSVWLVFSIVRGLAIRTVFKYDAKLLNNTLKLGLRLLSDLLVAPER